MPKNEAFPCPVCGFPSLPEPAYDKHGSASFDICPCCGTQFGYHDTTRSHAELRAAWLAAGAPWKSTVTKQPEHWDAEAQLKKAGLDAASSE